MENVWYKMEICWLINMIKLTKLLVHGLLTFKGKIQPLQSMRRSVLLLALSGAASGLGLRWREREILCVHACLWCATIVIFLRFPRLSMS